MKEKIISALVVCFIVLVAALGLLPLFIGD